MTNKSPSLKNHLGHALYIAAFYAQRVAVPLMAGAVWWVGSRARAAFDPKWDKAQNPIAPLPDYAAPFMIRDLELINILRAGAPKIPLETPAEKIARLQETNTHTATTLRSLFCVIADNISYQGKNEPYIITQENAPPLMRAIFARIPVRKKDKPRASVLFLKEFNRMAEDHTPIQDGKSYLSLVNDNQIAFYSPPEPGNLAPRRKRAEVVRMKFGHHQGE